MVSRLCYDGQSVKGAAKLSARRPSPGRAGARYAVFYLLPVFLYGVVVFHLSSLSRFPEQMPSFWGLDKVLHFGEYYLFGYLIRRCFPPEGDGKARQWKAVAGTVTVGMLYALSDELHQAFVPGRDSSYGDFLFDAAGVICAAFTFTGVRRRWEALRRWEERLERMVTGL